MLRAFFSFKLSVLTMDLNRSMFMFWCLFFSLLVTNVPTAILATSLYLGTPYFRCTRNTTNATALPSTFTHNLNTALHNLTSLSSQGFKYANISAGSGSNKVYAIFQCRGDQTVPLCSECVANATYRLPQFICPSSIGARIQLDGCYLRYDNESFLSPDFNYVIGLCSTTKTSDPVALTAINSLVQNVTALAPTEGGFSSASADGMYAAAQCLGYLTESDCAQCLLKVPYRTVCDSTVGEQVHLTSCYYRFEAYKFFETPSSPVPSNALAPGPARAPPVNASTQPSALTPSHKGPKTAIIAAGASVASIIALTVLCVILVWRYRASRTTDVKPVSDGENVWSGQFAQSKARIFSLQELETATGNFHPDNKLGEGGYGPVYKGTLVNGEQVAIKKLAIGSHQGKHEFLNEVGLITSVQHKNLIRLLGSCVEGPEKILVYEYLPNKSLDIFLFDDRRIDKALDWPTRYGIILGMAKGLAYLHEESQIRIVHRDVKPSNILLDHQLNPIIADFGLARLIQDNETHINTRVAGTVGYLAPEYALYGNLSEKVDVYSFGLVSLEILSGKQNLNSKLLDLTWRLYVHKNMLNLIDRKLGNAFSPEQAIRVAHVALLCTQENPNKRPSMSTVTLYLSGNSEILQIPDKPAFLNFSES